MFKEVEKKVKFKKIQRLNSELWKLIHSLTEEEYREFLESKYAWIIEV